MKCVIIHDVNAAHLPVPQAVHAVEAVEPVAALYLPATHVVQTVEPVEL